MLNKLLKFFKALSAFIFFSITVAGLVVTGFLFREFAKAPEITKDRLMDNLTSRIYDRNGNVIATLGNERREFVSSNDIPQLIKDAVLSIEDSRFYSHIGIDPKRIVKAMMVNAAAGDTLEGGSTITQQVVKRSLLTSQKSYERKIQEAYLSLQLEQKYTKEDILEMYLNKIFYSDNQYGIKSAAKYFYNKELKDLTIPQVALLAGIPQQPVGFNPYDNPEAAKERRDTVLYAMYNNGKISKKDYDDAIASSIDDGLIMKEHTDRKLNNLVNPKYSAYIDFVEKEVRSLPEFAGENDPFSLGLQVHTNINGELQESIQTMLDEGTYPMIQHETQTAIVVLNTKNGLVEAIGGGKDYTYSGFNFAVDSKLQPASAIKPVLDYAPGIEYFNWDSETQFADTPYSTDGQSSYIHNWDRQFRGNISMRRSVAQSYNIPAVRAWDSLGFDRVRHFANKLGINVTSQNPTTAIGGSEDTVTPVQMAGAFAAFGNEGKFNKPSAIVKIQDGSGNDIPINRESRQAMNPSTAFIITDVLKDVLTNRGTSPEGAVSGYDIAGKTGSSTFDYNQAVSLGIDPENDTKDSWLVGYTTDYTVSVWQGPDIIDSYLKALKYHQTQSTDRIFAHVMRLAHNGKVPEPFKKPDTVEQINGVYFAKDRNTETDSMYAGTAQDATVQAKSSEESRALRAATKTALAAVTSRSNSNSSSTSSAVRTNNSRTAAVNNTGSRRATVATNRRRTTAASTTNNRRVTATSNTRRTTAATRNTTRTQRTSR
ncbi:MAG: transglycosylase domain-containing protein [Gemella sp.]|nr:transglycosylase domain-containing protein [Gemella sp.]